MSRVRVLVEGQTEQSFVRDVLAPSLLQNGVCNTYPVLFRQSGGISRYARARKEILNSLKEDQGLYCTTMVDFYGMPKDWPGMEQACDVSSVQEKAKVVEDALLADIQGEMGDSFNPDRFIPYVQMHEFEAILFADPVKFAQSLNEVSLAEQFQAICDEFACPEEINDNYETAPSRRIVGVYSSYQKVLDGVLASKQIGLDRIREKCSHFDQWLCRLEQLGNRAEGG